MKILAALHEKLENSDRSINLSQFFERILHLGAIF
jgi:hypothetical protein